MEGMNLQQQIDTEALNAAVGVAAQELGLGGDNHHDGDGGDDGMDGEGDIIDEDTQGVYGDNGDYGVGVGMEGLGGIGIGIGIGIGGIGEDEKEDEDDDLQGLDIPNDDMDGDDLGLNLDDLDDREDREDSRPMFSRPPSIRKGKFSVLGSRGKTEGYRADSIACDLCHAAKQVSLDVEVSLVVLIGGFPSPSHSLYSFPSFLLSFLSLVSLLPSSVLNLPLLCLSPPFIVYHLPSFFLPFPSFFLHYLTLPSHLCVSSCLSSHLSETCSIYNFLSFIFLSSSLLPTHYTSSHQIFPFFLAPYHVLLSISDINLFTISLLLLPSLPLLSFFLPPLFPPFNFPLYYYSSSLPIFPYP